jgi:glycosyltransferase involved in cell wall biosynthesis
MIKLGVILDEPFLFYREDYYSFANWYIFADAIANHFDEAVLYVPVKTVDTLPQGVSIVEINNMTINGRFYYSSFYSYYLRLFFNVRNIRKLVRNIIIRNDIVLTRLPNALTPFLVKNAKKSKKKFVTIVAGNIVTQSNVVTNGGLMSFIAKPFVQKISSYEHELAKISQLVIAYGDELEKRFLPYSLSLLKSKTATIYDKNLFSRNDTFHDCSNVTVIRVASIIRSKGIDLFLELAHKLRNKYIGVSFKFISAGRIADLDYYEELKNYIKEYKLEDVVMFHSHVKFGEELFDLYKMSDVQIITSKSEGVPRAIIEGASMSLPLIATKVGGIPSAVEDGVTGLLVSPDSVDEIVDAFDVMYNNSTLRKKLIKQSFAQASDHTIEKASLSIANSIKSLCDVETRL